MPDEANLMTDPTPNPLDRRDLIGAAGLAVGALAVYVATLAPGLLTADSAELQTQAVTLGYAHPTGYPVYLLMAKAATLLPVRDVAYRVNLFSAIMGAVAAAGVYLLGVVLTGRRLPALVGAVAYGLAPTFWSQAIIAKVYTSGIVCMLGVLLGMALWLQSVRVRWLFVAALIGGISLGVHSTQSLLAPAAILVVLLRRERWRANWSAAAGGAALGTAITLAAFWIIDRADSPTSYFRSVIIPSRSNWGLKPRDYDTFLGRVRLSMTAPQYRPLLFSKPRETGPKAAWYLGNLQNEFPLPFLLIALGGVFWLGWRNPRMTLLLLLGGASHLWFDLHYDMGGIEVLYLSTYVPLVLFGVTGLALIEDLLTTAAWRVVLRRPVPKDVGVAVPPHLQVLLGPSLWQMAVGLVGLAIIVWPLFTAEAWNVEGRRDCWVPPEEDLFRVEFSAKLHDDVRRLVADLEPGAVVFTGWDFVYPYYYVAHVEQGRTDLVFMQDYPQAYYFELADSALDYVRREAARRPVYFTHVVRRVAAEYEMTPVRLGGQTFYRVGARRS